MKVIQVLYRSAMGFVWVLYRNCTKVIQGGCPHRTHGNFPIFNSLYGSYQMTHVYVYQIPQVYNFSYFEFHIWSQRIMPRTSSLPCTLFYLLWFLHSSYPYRLNHMLLPCTLFYTHGNQLFCNKIWVSAISLYCDYHFDCTLLFLFSHVLVFLIFSVYHYRYLQFCVFILDIPDIV